MVDETSTLQLEYPVGDNKLQICVPEEYKSGPEPLKVVTFVHLETYEVNHTLDVDMHFKNAGVAALFFCKSKHFKVALKEFAFLDDNDKLSIKV